jgi:ketosteroid isomerase-like protein
MEKAIETEKQLITLCNQYSDAYLSKDISSLDSILADDWTLITADCGDEVNKAKQLKDLKDGTLRVEAINDSDVKVRVYGDAAIVTGRRQSKVTNKKHDVSDLTRFSQFYILQEGRWRCVRTQVTSIQINPERHAD